MMAISVLECQSDSFKPAFVGVAFLCLFCAVTTATIAQSPSVNDSLQAENVLEKGLQLQDEAAYRKSNTYLAKAGNWFRSNSYFMRAAHCYNHVSSNYNLMSRLDSAEVYARKALSLIPEFVSGDKTEEVRSCTLLGLIHARQADYERAQNWLKRASKYIDHPSVGVSLKTTVIGSLGYLYDDLGEYDRAISLYEEGLETLTSIPDPPKEQIAKLYNNLGYTYTNKGLYDQSLEFYRKELKTNIELKGEKHPDIAGAYINIGSGYYRKGDWGEALLYFQRSLDIVRQTVGESHNMGALNYDNIGLCNVKLGNYEEGISSLQKAVEIKQKILNPDHPDVAESYKHIGMAFAEQNNYTAALDYYERALAIQQNSLGDRHPKLVDTYNKLGEYYVEQENPERALSYLEKSESVINKSLETAHPALAVVRTLTGRALTQLGQTDRGLNSIQQALSVIAGEFEPHDYFINPDIASIDHPLYAVNTLFEKAKLLHRYGKADNENPYLVASFSTYNLLSDLLDQLQVDYMDDRSKLTISEKSHSIYESAIQTSYDLYRETGERDYLQRIFFFAEKSKARVMLEQLNRGHAQNYAGIPDSLIQFEQQLKYQTNRIREEIDRLLSTEDPPDVQLSMLRDSLFSVNRRFAKHIEYMENEYPRYHELKYATEIPSVSDIQAELQPDEAVIEYVLGDSALYTLVLRDNLFDVHKVPHTSVDADITALKEAIIHKNKSGYLQYGRKLYEILVEPLKSDLDNLNRLFIVPDKSLALLPFGALLTDRIEANENEDISYRNLPYLIRKYAFNILPSVTMANALMEPEKVSFGKDFLAFAPVFNKGEKADISSSREENSGWSYLPSSRDEIEQIARRFKDSHGFWSYLWNGDNTRLYTGATATESNFKRSSGEAARYIHLATHAFVSELRPDSTGIVFHPETSGAEDGILYAREIYNLSMNTDLVVLSACETGLGSVIQGEGVMGLSRAFRYAGAANMLVSLWKIDDRSSSFLMVSFYEELLKGANKQEALRLSQLSLIGDIRYAHPYHWAAFNLLGPS